MLLIIVIVVGVCLLTIVVIDTVRLGIGPMPTSPRVKQRLLEALPKEVQGDVLELGSGWGSLAWPLAKHYPNNRVVAWEGALVPWLFQRVWMLFSCPKNLQLQYGNFLNENLNEAGLVICYLYPGAMEVLAENLEMGKKVIVTHTFRLPGQVASDVIECDDLYRTPIYIYNT